MTRPESQLQVFTQVTCATAYSTATVRDIEQGHEYSTKTPTANLSAAAEAFTDAGWRFIAGRWWCPACARAMKDRIDDSGRGRYPLGGRYG